MTAQPNPVSLCLVTAVDVEFKTAISLLRQPTLSNEAGFKRCCGFFGDRRVTVLQCGMSALGFDQWLRAHLENNHYETLVVAGLAGALKPILKTGDIVVYDLCWDRRDGVAEERAEIHCNQPLTEFLHKRFQDASLRYFQGTGITVSRIITDAEDKLRLGLDHGAWAVDMESYDVLRVAADFNLPAAVIRVVSDEASHDLPDFNYAAEAGGKMNYQRLAAAMFRRPAASLRFLASLKLVMNSLRESLQVVLRV
ncbi:MAG TPA: hypothetical protein PLK30_00355 [Blastocatellia bacterium]|nr:hypothetical protein [Blastocatellia bacterium]